jgi:hypothetical protein
MSIFTPEQRYDWIENYLIEHEREGPVDVLNRDFIDAYSADTGANVFVQMYGANKCPMLGRDLAFMAKEYRLKRFRSGVQGMAGMGFPRWVWSYRLHPLNPYVSRKRLAGNPDAQSSN